MKARSAQEAHIKRIACLAALLPCAELACAAAAADNTAVGSTCQNVAAPPPRLVRLTRMQYDNAIEDLLRDRSRPGQDFPSDGQVGPFDVALPVDSPVMERYWEAADKIAARAMTNLAVLTPCLDENEGCARAFIRDFGRRVFRRPLDREEIERYATRVYRPARTVADHRTAIGAVLRAFLLSPHFVYRVERAPRGAGARPLDPYELATRLSFFLWQSPPDDALLEAAASGKLADSAGRLAETDRLAAHPKAGRMHAAFATQWLGLDELDHVARRSKKQWNGGLKKAMRDETTAFVADHLRTPGRTFVDLMTSTTSTAGDLLAPIYGGAPAGGVGSAPRSLPPGERAGLLTQASILAALSPTEETLPFLRGNWVLQTLLCREPGSPRSPLPPAPERLPAETTRQYWERFPEACQGCHEDMNGLGFAFQSYDAFGRFRKTEPTERGEAPIDTSGWLDDDKFGSVVELAHKLANSEEARLCMVNNLFTFALSRAPAGPGANTALRRVAEPFAAGPAELPGLLRAVATSDGFRCTGPDEAVAPR